MKLNAYNLTAFGIIGVLSSFIISKSGLEVYLSIPLALILAFACVSIANRMASGAEKGGGDESDS